MGLSQATRMGRDAAVFTAARDLLAAHGFDGVTMRELARASGVTVATLYNRYPNKESILAAAVLDLFRHQIDTGQMTEPPGHGVTRILRTIEAPLAIMEAMPEYSRAVLTCLERLGPECTEGIFLSVQREFALGIIELREDERLRGDLATRDLARALYNMVEGAVRSWLWGLEDIDSTRRNLTLGALLLLSGAGDPELRAEIDGMTAGGQLPPAVLAGVAAAGTRG